MFLKGTTNQNGENQDVEELGYQVHPAFRDGKNNQYHNGEWNEEITGIWVAKFEAGYAGQENTATQNIEVVNTNLQYQRETTNVFGVVEEQKTYMTYPVFMGKAFTYNNLQVGEMYELAKNLNQSGNPYGFNQTVDTHMMKNSEWGAVAYLAHSAYGRNGEKITINNLDVSKAIAEAITVTGYAGNKESAVINKVEKIDTKLLDNYNDKSYAWYTKEGVLASTTANQYGIYDMNGGASEYIARIHTEY